MCLVRGPTEGRRKQERGKDSAKVGGGGLVRENYKELMTFELCLVTGQTGRWRSQSQALFLQRHGNRALWEDRRQLQGICGPTTKATSRLGPGGG